MIVYRALAIGCLAFAAALDCASFVHCQDPPKPSAAKKAVPVASDKRDTGQQDSGTPSDAERIARLDRSLESDQKRMAELKASLANPDHEYADAEAEFEQLDSQLAEKRKQSEGRANPETERTPVPMSA